MCAACVALDYNTVREYAEHTDRREREENWIRCRRWRESTRRKTAPLEFCTALCLSLVTLLQVLGLVPHSQPRPRCFPRRARRYARFLPPSHIPPRKHAAPQYWRTAHPCCAATRLLLRVTPCISDRLDTAEIAVESQEPQFRMSPVVCRLSFGYRFLATISTVILGHLIGSGIWALRRRRRSFVRTSSAVIFMSSWINYSIWKADL